MRARAFFFLPALGWGERDGFFVTVALLCLPRLTGLCLGELMDRDNPMSGYCERAVKYGGIEVG